MEILESIFYILANYGQYIGTCICSAMFLSTVVVIAASMNSSRISRNEERYQ